MAYSNKIIAEILVSVDKIGLSKTSGLFNVRCSSISRWMKTKSIQKSIPIKIKASKIQKSRELVLRRIPVKNSLMGNNCYIYNVKDLYSGLEFNCIAYHNNYQTPVTLLKYVLRAMIKETNINSYEILIKGFTRVKNFDKFCRTYAGCKINVRRTEENFRIESIDQKEVSLLSNESTLIKFLTDEQLRYNISNNKDNYSDLQYLLPINLDKFYYNNLLEYDKNSISFELSGAVERILAEANQFLRRANYGMVWKYLGIAKVILNKNIDKKMIIPFYSLKTKYYTNQGDYQDALIFLHKELAKAGKNEEEQLFLIIKMCNIYLKNYELKKIDYYFKKMKLLYNETFSCDILLEYDLIVSKRESIYLPIEQSVISYIEILKKHKQSISQSKLFDIYIQISKLYYNISNFDETHNFLEKAANLPIIKEDKYLLCEYYKWKCESYLNHGQFNDLKEYCNDLKNVSKEYNYKSFYYFSMGLTARSLLQQGLSTESKIEAEKYLNYGIMTSNKNIIFNGLNLMFLFYSRVGNIQKALKFSQKQFELCKFFLSVRKEFNVVINNCVLLSKLPNKDAMLPYLEMLEKNIKILKDPGIIIRTFTLRACYYQFKKEQKLALKFYTKALKNAQKNKFPNLTSIIYSHIAIIKRELKEFKSAIFCIDQSISYSDNTNSNYEMPRLVFIKAKIYFESNNFIKAKTFLIQAKELSLKYNNKSILSSCIELERILFNTQSQNSQNTLFV